MKNPLAEALMRLKSSENLLKEVGSLSTEELESVLFTIDESNHSVDEWADALMEITAFSERNQRSLALQHRLAYLSCCAEAQSQSGALTELKSILQYFLNTEGISGMKKL